MRARGVLGMRRGDAIRAALVLSGFFAAISPAAAELRSASREEHIAASVTFNFARFAQWQGGESATASAPLVLCVFDPNASDAWSRLDGQTIGARRLALKIVGQPSAENGGCHIAFISDALDEVSPKDFAEKGVLTISDSENFLRRGGAIQLVIGKSDFKFDINDAALKRAGVKLSSKLMRVGMKVSVPAN
jgi:hypothetical protein